MVPCWGVSLGSPSCLWSSDCRWRGSAWGWPQCTSLRPLHPAWEIVRWLSWGTHQGQFHKISKQLPDEKHRWRRLYTSYLMGLSEWRKEFCSKRKRFLRKVEKQKWHRQNTWLCYWWKYQNKQAWGAERLTEEIRNVNILKVGKL